MGYNLEAVYQAALAAFLGYQAAGKMPGLLEAFGSAQDVLHQSGDTLTKAGFLTPALERYWQSEKQRSMPEKIYDFCKKEHVRILTWQDVSYPERLRHITAPPPVLYVKGELSGDDPTLAIVGARKATNYGLSVAEQFATALAASHVCIVSGGALGVDAASHNGALKGGGKTLAVLGSGLGFLYPRSNLRLFSQIVENGGALMTEFAPWVEPLGRQFPMRNRIIVGLSQAVLVTEAALKSGAMITARLAVEENRELLSIPGPITSETSQGTNRLLKEGAHVITCPEEILQILGVGVTQEKKLHYQEPSLFAEVPREEGQKLQALHAHIKNHPGQTLDTLAEQFPWPIAALSTYLLQLEMAGLIVQDLGNHYRSI